MKKKDKILLWQDISTKFPYKVKFQSYNIEGRVDEIYDIGFGGEGLTTPIINHVYGLEDIKIYLRPLSNMTKKEQIEFEGICNFTLCFDFDYGEDNGFKNTNWNSLERNIIDREVFCATIDWLNKHHFDYRGLIYKGLALPAPKGMYV